MSLNDCGFKELERISREFLWGKNENGDFRNVLATWDDLALSKAKGGVGIKDLHNLSLILKMRWCGWLLTDNQAS